MENWTQYAVYSMQHDINVHMDGGALYIIAKEEHYIIFYRAGRVTMMYISVPFIFDQFHQPFALDIQWNVECIGDSDQEISLRWCAMYAYFHLGIFDDIIASIIG